MKLCHLISTLLLSTILTKPGALQSPEPNARPLVTAKWSSDGPPVPVLAFSAFVNVELMLRLLNSIDYHVQRLIIIHNGRHSGVTQTIQQLRREHPEWTIESHPDNLGCASSWNRILDLAPKARYYIIVNDDIAFKAGMLRRFALGAERHLELLTTGRSNRVVLYPSHGTLMHRSPIWSCYALLRPAIDVVGRFDDNLWPAYHEDYDYMVRLARAGLWQELLPEVRVQHGYTKNKYRSGMVQSIKRQPRDPVIQLYQQQQQWQERGNPYYALKWGQGERLGMFGEREADWNRTCRGDAPQRKCRPMQPLLYSRPFNDSSLPLSFFRFDPQLRRCIQTGHGAPCRYNVSLVPHPELVPHDVYVTRKRRWRRFGERMGWFPWS